RAGRGGASGAAPAGSRRTRRGGSRPAGAGGRGRDRSRGVPGLERVAGRGRAGGRRAAAAPGRRRGGDRAGGHDPLLFGSRLVDQYETARALGFTDAELAALAASSIRISAAPDEVKERLLRGVRDWLAPLPASR